MKFKLLAFFLFFNYIMFSQVYDYQLIRYEFKNSIDNKQNALKWFILLKNTPTNNDPILEGYKACFYFIMSKHAVFYKKLTYFKQGKNMLEKSISENTNCIELYFLRLSIQKKLPKILNYYSNIESDIRFLKKNISKVKEKYLKEEIIKLLN